MPLDPAKLDEFMTRAFGEVSAAISIPLCIVGERLGLYRALKDAGALTPAELAERTKTSERYVREWLQNQAAAGFVTLSKDTGRYVLPDEQAAALADESSPAYLHGAFDLVTSMFSDLDTLTDAFRSGRGVPWSEHHPSLFKGVERFFRNAYRQHLVSEWIPAMTDVHDRLLAGAHVADVGCGHGASTVILAQHFPKSNFVGIDAHEASIARAREAAAAAGAPANVTFEVASATDFRGREFDFVLTLDCLHDMGDPLGAARHILLSMRRQASWMIVEPFAGDRPEDNLNPVGRTYYAASTFVCVPASLAHGGPALGAQAGEERIRQIVTNAGFTRFRRAAETPFNLVYEARP